MANTDVHNGLPCTSLYLSPFTALPRWDPRHKSRVMGPVEALVNYCQTDRKIHLCGAQNSVSANQIDWGCLALQYYYVRDSEEAGDVTHIRTHAVPWWIITGTTVLYHINIITRSIGCTQCGLSTITTFDCHLFFPDCQKQLIIGSTWVSRLVGRASFSPSSPSFFVHLAARRAQLPPWMLKAVQMR